VCSSDLIDNAFAFFSVVLNLADYSRPERN
jgi:hypothetical protein